ncbi:MAG TPA: cytochrome c [Pyrinomonadaceae bacterium]|jgi:mono/diheme cytochrome c family protein|nr:cytochrome c [Pyrinomonadaceae bacterium]
MDMQDQPRYEVYEPSKSYSDGLSSRPLVEGTVARGHLREDAYFFTGQAAGGGAGMTGMSGGANGQGVSGNVQPGERQSLTSGTAVQGGGDVNRRGNAAGGIPNPAGNAGASGGGASGASGGMAGGPDVFPFPITADDLRRGRERFNAYCSMCHGMTGEGDGMIVRRGFQRPPSFHDDRLQEGTTPASHFFDVMTNGWGAMPAYNYMIPPEDRWKIIAYVRALQISRRATIEDVPPAERGKLSGGGAQQQHAGGEPQHGGQEH